MKVSIIGTVPTVYQYSSLRAFGIGAEKTAGGSFTGRLDFPNIREARAYLKRKAHDLYEGDTTAIRRHLGRNTLSYDAATVRIVPRGKAE